MEIYQGYFKDWDAVVDNFFYTAYGDEQAKANAREANPEPDQVLLASYGGGGYDGDALVAYRQGDKYYTIEGGHCSCYGLEGQWKPEEYDYETFMAVLDRKIDSCSADRDYPSMDKNTWALIKKRAQSTAPTNTDGE